MDRYRGLDHGAWVPLKLIYPEATVPVVQMSVNPWAPPAEQYRIGQALAPLRREGVMILASGGTIHNFRTIRWDDPPEADAWAVAFDDWLLERIAGWDLPALFDYEQQAPGARLAVPPGGNEHFIPLFYALGAADDQRTCGSCTAATATATSATPSGSSGADSYGASLIHGFPGVGSTVNSRGARGVPALMYGMPSTRVTAGVTPSALR